MKYLEPFLYFARKPETGYKNVLWLCVASLVPYVGEMVILGYRGEVSDALERDPDLKKHPDVSLDKLTPYLMRGIWPFLTRFLLSFLFIPLIEVFAFLAGVIAYQIAGELILAYIAGLAVLLLTIPLLTAILWPMTYYAQMTQKFAPMDEIKFAIRFLRLCGLTTLVAVLMFSMLGMVLLMLGMCLCFVGVFPAAAIYQMAEQHMMSQLYQHYLEEGGEPIAKAGERTPRIARADDDFDDDRADEDRLPDGEKSHGRSDEVQ